MKLYVPTLCALFLTGAPVVVYADTTLPPRTVRTTAPHLEARKIVLVGDSTMAPVSGWASAFCGWHVSSSVACLNLGRGGRSTRSYRDEGSWDLALNEASVEGYAATYVLIQFGHNDQNVNPAAWTEMKKEFPDNLRRFVSEIRDLGAIPVLITPMVRRQFKNGVFYNSLQPWSDEVGQVAREMKVPVIDLNASSAKLVEALGESNAEHLAQLPRGMKISRDEKSANISGPQYMFTRKYDPTHLGDNGARVVASLVAKELATIAPDLKPFIAP